VTEARSRGTATVRSPGGVVLLSAGPDCRCPARASLRHDRS